MAVPCNQLIRLYASTRSAWDEHVQLTRMLIISFAAGLPDFEVAKKRLLGSPVSIVAAMSGLVAPAWESQLYYLLVQHLEESLPVIQAARAGDQAALAAAVNTWRQNGSQIAAVLSQATGMNYQTANALVQKHLDTTIAEASARLKGDWLGDVQAYSAVRNHALTMADSISSAIAQNQPIAVTPLY